ncbi:MAG: SDR family NAD(P)-dependent oxidoreductase [Bryobacteraceae bacterium]
MRLQGKTALITGSDQGIGRGIAIRYAEEGANVAINYRRNRAGGEQTKADVEKLGRRAAVIQADISKAGETQRLFDEAVRQVGPIDILVNNAGIEIRADIFDIKEEDYRTVVDTNMTGPLFLTQAFARYAREHKRGGKVINISSVHEELPFPNFTPYCMAKSGMKMMMRNLALELAPLGITVNNIAPGAIETPINTKLLNDPKLLSELLANIPLGRLGQPNDVSGLCAFLASSDADYVTGSTFFVDGGLTWNYSEQ